MKRWWLQFKALEIGEEFVHEGIRLRKTSQNQYLPNTSTEKMRLAPNAERVDTGWPVHVDITLKVKRYAIE